MDKWAFPADFEISSVAATSNGCAATFGDSRFALCWPDELDLTHIYFRTSPHCFGCQCLGQVFGKARVCFSNVIYNSSVVSVLQNKS